MSELKVESAPEDVGMSTGRLERIRGYLQRYVDDGQLPGFLVAWPSGDLLGQAEGCVVVGQRACFDLTRRRLGSAWQPTQHCGGRPVFGVGDGLVFGPTPVMERDGPSRAGHPHTGQVPRPAASRNYGAGRTPTGHDRPQGIPAARQPQGSLLYRTCIL